MKTDGARGLLLVLDTSTRYAGAALWREDDAVASVSWRSTGNHTRELMPAIRRLLEMVDGKPEDLAGVGVALGPGGFSAVRVGMSAAKGLALPLKLPLVGVGTLEMEAYRLCRHRTAGPAVDRRGPRSGGNRPLQGSRAPELPGTSWRRRGCAIWTRWRRRSSNPPSSAARVCGPGAAGLPRPWGTGPWSWTGTPPPRGCGPWAPSPAAGLAGAKPTTPGRCNRCTSGGRV